MTRPRGFIEQWRPQKRTLAKLEWVQRVLITYEDYLPLTIRQIFYRLVGLEAIEKTEKEYGHLCDLLNVARRAEQIDMDAIRDDGGADDAVRIGYTGPDELIADFLHSAERYRIDRQAGQDRRIVLWCEAAGMVPQLKRVATPYGVSVKSSGGFDSLTTKHALGMAMENALVLHVGDYDASGECMFDALQEDIEAFASSYGNEVEFVRLAVTPDQIAEHNLATAPPKASTHQVRKQLSYTTQAEALDPADLAEIVRNGIESHMDTDIYRQAVKREAIEKDWLREKLSGLK